MEVCHLAYLPIYLYVLDLVWEVVLFRVFTVYSICVASLTPECVCVRMFVFVC